MPELPEEMYCSQQICIPPSFPYLLRQYAKAAIRTQPADLLRWSTAYFRCLSLNLRPPVKPRLEYPIPKSHYGITPGWLKALMYQLQNTLTIPFKTLWDRWIGACMQHQDLIETLCLGGFTDPDNIPWYRFLALCASYLTESLTQTMILICEIVTEEPEGGSAMISLETFVDLYRFLADIDASVGQYIKNLYFTDSLLSLYREPVMEVEKESTVEEVVEEEEEVVEEEEKKIEVVIEKPKEKLVGVVISCPDIAADDYKTEEDFVLQEKANISAEESVSAELESKKSETSSPVSNVPESVSEKSHISYAPDTTSPETEAEYPKVGDSAAREDQSQLPAQAEDATSKRSEVADTASTKSAGTVSKKPEVADTASKKSAVSKKSAASAAKDATSQKSGMKDAASQKSHASAIKDAASQKSATSTTQDATSSKSKTSAKSRVTDTTSQKSRTSAKTTTDKESVATVVGYMPPRQRDLERLEDLRRREEDEMEIEGESSEDGMQMLVQKPSSLMSSETETALSETTEDHKEDEEMMEEEEEEQDKTNLIWVDAIPGIGGRVPLELVEAVVKYMNECAIVQHGMVMPRNVRHYNCPPLEVVEK